MSYEIDEHRTLTIEPPNVVTQILCMMHDTRIFENPLRFFEFMHERFRGSEIVALDHFIHCRALAEGYENDLLGVISKRWHSQEHPLGNTHRPRLGFVKFLVDQCHEEDQFYQTITLEWKYLKPMIDFRRIIGYLGDDRFTDGCGSWTRDRLYN